MWSQNKRGFLLTFLIYVIGFGLVTNIYAQDLTNEQIREDFEFLNNALAECHPGLYWYNSKQEFDKTKQKVEARLDGVSNVTQLQSLLVDINNTIACGHTAILLPEAHYKMVDSVNLFLPFNIALVEGKVLVSESFTRSLSMGDELLSINGEAIDKLMAQLERLFLLIKRL